LSKVPNISSVQAASFGLKNHLDATIWHADVNINSAIDVVANMVLANAES
jgi:hypothetical protein